MSTNENGDQTRRILGIDPGLNVTGYGVIESCRGRVRLREAGIVRGSSGASLATRVSEIHTGVVDVIENLQPEVVAIEELFSHYQRPRTAILMGHARGVICLAAAQRGLHVESYAATKVKKLITGSGRAPKTQVQFAVTRELQLTEVPEPHDVTDALAIALCHHYSMSNAVRL
ncbi:MAG: crossover junction endodeoxyribonuclease RuvC [Pirellulaceae bacterium]|mgnify:FL=1|nr:crossover junction endodeoxyribonuclease RuvC [Pirellulaceae bacterium]